MKTPSSGIFFALLVVIAMQGCGLFSSSPSSGPRPALSVVQATDLGPIPTNPDILGRDGGYSALFQGYSVWLYGDTFLAKPNYEDRTLLSDTWSFTTDLNAQDGITGFHEPLDSVGAPTMILPETPAEQAFNQAHNGTNCQTPPCGDRWALWPSAIVANPADSTALIFYMVVSARPGNFNFQGIGTSVAIWQNIQQQPKRPSLAPPIVPNHPDLLFTQNEPGFGSAALISNGMLYAYGCDYNSGCKLGKVAPANAQVRGALEFLCRQRQLVRANWRRRNGLQRRKHSQHFLEHIPAMLRRALQPAVLAKCRDPNVREARRSMVPRNFSVRCDAARPR